MGAPTKRARKIRKASEFDVAQAILAMRLQPPPTAIGSYAWSLADIVNARNAQMTGRFKMAARLAESMRTDDAIHVARSNRLAPQRAIKVELVPAKGAGAGKIANEAAALFGQGGIGITPDTMRDVHDCLVVHSVAFALAVPSVRADGSRVDYTLRYWPIEFVRWDPHARVFKTQVDGGFEETICHGDGRWVVFQEGEFEPFKNGALLAAAMVWARHAFAIRDWSKSSVAHGSAKAIGTMPDGVPTKKAGADGSAAVPSDEAAAMMELLRAIVSSDAPVGLLPFGADVKFLTNNSTAWQVFAELVLNAERAAARIFLGTDGILGAQGGAPGVDVQALFGVAATKVQADLMTIERALQTGLIEVWCAVNFGTSALAPYRKYLIPDPETDALKKSLADRTTAFSAALKGRTDAGITLTQDDVNGLAADFKVRAPLLTSIAQPSAPAASA